MLLTIICKNCSARIKLNLKNLRYKRSCNLLEIYKDKFTVGYKLLDDIECMYCQEKLKGFYVLFKEVKLIEDQRGYKAWG